MTLTAHPTGTPAIPAGSGSYLTTTLSAAIGRCHYNSIAHEATSMFSPHSADRELRIPFQLETNHLLGTMLTFARCT